MLCVWKTCSGLYDKLPVRQFEFVPLWGIKVFLFTLLDGLIVQIDEHSKRLLWVGEKRTVKTLLRFFRYENANGLLRQYFPMSMELIDVTKRQVLDTVHKLNSRPRKCLGFKTPYKVFEELTGINEKILTGYALMI